MTSTTNRYFDAYEQMSFIHIPKFLSSPNGLSRANTDDDPSSDARKAWKGFYTVSFSSSLLRMIDKIEVKP